MPAQYEALVRKLLVEKLSAKAAKSKAAAIYNSTHKQDPVTRNYDQTHRGQRK